MKSHKFAFTLAELMIVLSVIGILSAILLPVAFQSTPDKDILKFKKANNTLATVVRELATSGKYYKYGSLAYPNISESICPSPTYASVLTYLNVLATDPEWKCGPVHFCNSFADVVSAKSVKCDQGEKISANHVNIATDASGNKFSITDKANLSVLCDNMIYRLSSGPFINYVKTADNVIFYEANSLFGSISKPNHTTGLCSSNRIKKTDVNGEEYCADENGLDDTYQAVCIDIDGFDGPIKPFSYAIRSDGKIKTSLRVDWWLKRDITKKETECCPKELEQVTGLDGSVYNYCDGVPVCAE